VSEGAEPANLSRRIRLGLLAAFVVFVAIQLAPYRVHNHATVAEPNWNAPLTRTLAVAACYDCHSNHANVLAFEQVAPLSWWITNHVNDGRAALNFSECRVRRESEGSRAVREGSMPPSYYTWFGLHANAKLTAAQRQTLADGLDATAALGCK
jgi:hypothetical protein